MLASVIILVLNNSGDGQLKIIYHFVIFHDLLSFFLGIYAEIILVPRYVLIVLVIFYW